MEQHRGQRIVTETTDWEPIVYFACVIAYFACVTAVIVAGIIASAISVKGGPTPPASAEKGVERP